MITGKTFKKYNFNIKKDITGTVLLKTLQYHIRILSQTTAKHGYTLF